MKVTYPFALYILPSLAETLNLSRGVLCDDCRGWHEKPVGAGGAPRGSTARAEPQRGARGQPLVPATTIINASSSRSCLPLALSLLAGGRYCPLGCVGQPSPSSSLPVTTSSMRRNHGVQEPAAGGYPELLDKLFRTVRFGKFSRSWREPI